MDKRIIFTYLFIFIERDLTYKGLLYLSVINTCGSSIQNNSQKIDWVE